MTDPLGNTSNFSSPHSVAWDCSSSNPAPQLISVNPIEVKRSDPTLLINLVGSGFIPVSVVQFNSIALTTHYVDSSHLEAISHWARSRSQERQVSQCSTQGPAAEHLIHLRLSILALTKIYLPGGQKISLDG